MSRRAGRVGKEGSLKHRILSRPSIDLPGKFSASSPDESMQSSSNGSRSSPSSSSTTPVASPGSSHSSNGVSYSRNDPVGNLKRPHPVDKHGESPSGYPLLPLKSELNISTNSSPSSPIRSPNSIKSGTVVSPLHFSSPSKMAGYQPHQFARGSLIQLANGSLKTVESMSSDDFIRSANASPNLKVDFSEIARIEKTAIAGGTGPSGPSMVVYFRPRNRPGSHVAVEACEDHPFFVLGKGWSSACPSATMGRFGLNVVQLNAGDTCISLSCKELVPAALVTPTVNPTSLAHPPAVMPPPPKPQWISPLGSSSKRQHTGAYSPFIAPTSGREATSVGHVQSPTVKNDENNCRRGTLITGQSCASSAGASTSASADIQRSFSLNGTDVNAFRRWSAPEDDRFLDGFQK